MDISIQTIILSIVVTLLFSLWFHHNYLTPIREWNLYDWMFLIITSIFYPIGIIIMALHLTSLYVHGKLP